MFFNQPQPIVAVSTVRLSVASRALLRVMRRFRNSGNPEHASRRIRTKIRRGAWPERLRAIPEEAGAPSPDQPVLLKVVAVNLDLTQVHSAPGHMSCDSDITIRSGGSLPGHISPHWFWRVHTFHSNRTKKSCA